VGVVNRSQADINRNVDMLLARRKEKEYFESSPDYGHLAHKMGAEYLAKLLSEVRACLCCVLLCPGHLIVYNDSDIFHLFMQHLEAVIRQKIPSIIAMINKTIDEIEAELDRLGRPIGGDAGVGILLFVL
jgi:hypothetical protein